MCVFGVKGTLAQVNEFRPQAFDVPRYHFPIPAILDQGNELRVAGSEGQTVQPIVETGREIKKTHR